MFKVKNADNTSSRGQRKVSIGLEQAEGKEVLNGFDFNKNAPLDVVLVHEYNLDSITKQISITGFVPNTGLTIPQGATHTKISAINAIVDFETGDKSIAISNKETLLITNSSSDITLSFTNPTTGNGIELFLLKVEFLQELNSVLYPLKNGTYNALKLIKVV